MTILQSTPTYILLFISLYFEVFILLTYVEHRPRIKKENLHKDKKPAQYPTVTVIVPCWNEESTISKTLDSLLKLNYPKDKFEILVVDDGSTDNTWNVISTYTSHSNIKVFKKPNGGKYTALNFGLEHSQSDLVGCLDADSYVDPDALSRIVCYFEDPKTMAVTPSVKIYKPKTILQHIQHVEYGWGIFVRKLLSYIDALYVTPGPFSIFRREVFAIAGGYRHAHNTEDLELALRMQSHHMKIANAHNAIVYTVAPATLKKLYKQRLRWTYGFIKNTIDYRYIFFKKEYGNLGIFILPMASVSIVSGIYILGMTLWSFVQSGINTIERIMIVGFPTHFQMPSINIFSVSTDVIAIASLVAFLGTALMILVSRKMAEGKVSFGLDLIYFFTLYAFISPLWLAKALYNALFSVKTTWR